LLLFQDRAITAAVGSTIDKSAIKQQTVSEGVATTVVQVGWTNQFFLFLNFNFKTLFEHFFLKCTQGLCILSFDNSTNNA
jgi:hypothetical protein